MTSTDRRTRQYRVTHIPTGIVTVVNAQTAPEYSTIAYRAGWRYLVECNVQRVPEGQETPLPFDEIPLVLRPRMA